MPVEYSIVIPVFNSADSLVELHHRLAEVFDRIAPQNYEIIFVDDASTDDSWRMLEQLRRRDRRVKLIQHARNFGQHRATLCGMKYSSGEFVVTLDDDLQHPPEEIPKLIEAMRANGETDVVLGAYDTKRHSLLRNLATSLIRRLTAFIFKVDRGLCLTSFRLIRRSMVDELTALRTPRPRIGHMLLTVTHRIVNVPVRHDARRHGRSGYTLRRLVSDALDNVLTNSSLPLQFVSYLGFGSALAAVVLALYYLYRYFFIGVSVKGWTTIILLQLFFFGALLFSFGIVGEYLIRIMRQLTESPRTVIRRKEGFD